ncbi:AsnB Asparagine synthase (glutamine-hydrolyzing) [Sphingomonadaceae bacterium]
MCGIAGFWSSQPVRQPEGVIRSMIDSISYRGPDSWGHWLDQSLSLALGHRRLAIIDLSPAGHQPMESGSGRYVISYNGEIYNHLDIRDELGRMGVQNWRGHSDTETILAAVEQWGFEKALATLNGMFAFALWDRELQQLFIARDRLGEKPLYYGTTGDNFFFGSELKAFKPLPWWDGQIDRNVLASFLRHNYVPGRHSIYEGVAKLPAAHFVVVSDGGRNVSDPVCYWDLRQKARAGRTHRFVGSDNEAIDSLEALLTDAVGIRMASDVPLGAFLSGGYDSSTIVALMQKLAPSPVKTFSIGFDEKEYNEAEHAKRISRHLGTDHTELYVTSEDALATIPDLSSVWDEPFADSSQIPTLLVSKLARQKVTVSLSGDGGDELFCGYHRYSQGYSMWKKIGALPAPVRRALAMGLRKTPARSLEKIMPLLPQRLRVKSLGDRLLKLADVIHTNDGSEFYRSLVSHFKDPEAIVLGATEPESAFQISSDTEGVDFREEMMVLDLLNYLPDDILTKVDRASMAVSLESRVPMLDHRLVEFAQTLPLSLKIRNGESKWILRQLLYRHVPKKLMDRPKMGFAVPIEYWLGGPLRSWAGDLLSPARIAREGYFDAKKVTQMWEEHLSGRRRWHNHLWDILMFQSWLETQNK